MRCPLCGSVHETRSLLRWHGVPVHQQLLHRSRADARACRRGEIDLVACASCCFVWNRRFDHGLLEYHEDYEASQTFSASFRRYLESLVAQLVKDGLVRKRVVEIGAGDGVFLEELCRLGDNEGYGFDPSCAPGRRGRIKMVRAYYRRELLPRAPDLVCSRHVLEHVLDPVRFLADMVGDDASPETRYFVEVPNFSWSVQAAAFWDVYYEHCAYFTAATLALTLARAGLRATRLEEGFGGQYLLAHAVAAPGSTQPLASVSSSLVAAERFAASVPLAIGAARDQLRDSRARGRLPILWGAGARAAALLNILGLDDASVPFVVDVNPRKQGTFLSGTGHEICSPDALRGETASIFVTNPQYLAEIRGLATHLGPALEVHLLAGPPDPPS